MPLADSASRGPGQALAGQQGFSMPKRWPAERAARHIAGTLDRQPHGLVFLAASFAALRFTSLLPARLQYALGQRMARR
ncbi:hypothetical protein [Stutzerimonas zhaodongensis]|jgi:hypothetical protein|uniref:Short-chain dehydrogenase n=1 Tax=Stutzerimonas zhaodongensis TaxID=1176257 RepID=A0A365PQV5_9GAMM|nr:hypothetical protein [Stutzerimonas zhaodongensis]QWV15900.1 hypothetical protein KQ248_15355 [Stutzerimonas zhaodongensis]RBA54228.1 hypothetical protein DQ403_18020 [Stutzerimonas zhaodongensis]